MVGQAANGGGAPQALPKTNLPVPGFPALFSTSTPINLVFDPSQSMRFTPPSHPPPIRVHRFSYAFVTFCCARLPCPSDSHSSGVTAVSRVVWTAYRTSRFVIAFAPEPLLCFEGPIVKRGPEGPTTTGHGNLWERRTRRDDEGVGGSVAG